MASFSSVTVRVDLDLTYGLKHLNDGSYMSVNKNGKYHRAGPVCFIENFSLKFEAALNIY